MTHNNLKNYYQNAFTITHLHKFCSLTELENMYPYEADIYINLIKAHAEKLREHELNEKLMQEAQQKLRF